MLNRRYRSALCRRQTPFALQRDENVSVTAAGGEGTLAELSCHLSAARDDGGPLIEAHAVVRWRNRFKLDLPRTNGRKEGWLGDFRSAHHLNQDEVVNQNAIQRLNIACQERFEELLVCVKSIHATTSAGSSEWRSTTAFARLGAVVFFAGTFLG